MNHQYLDALASVFMYRTVGDDSISQQARDEAYHDFLYDRNIYHGNLAVAVSFIHALAVRRPATEFVLVVYDSQLVETCYNIINTAMMQYPENLQIVAATDTDLAQWFRGRNIEQTHFHLASVNDDVLSTAKARSLVVTIG